MYAGRNAKPKTQTAADRDGVYCVVKQFNFSVKIYRRVVIAPLVAAYRVTFVFIVSVFCGDCHRTFVNPTRFYCCGRRHCKFITVKILPNFYRACAEEGGRGGILLLDFSRK